MQSDPGEKESIVTRERPAAWSGRAPGIYSGSTPEVPPAAFVLPAEPAASAEVDGRSFKGLRGKFAVEAIFLAAIAGAIREHIADCWHYRKQH